MYASIRKYRTRSSRELTERVQQDFVPLVRELPGVVAYYALDAGNGIWVSVSMLQSREGVEKCNEVAADWVHKVASLLPVGSAELTSGELVIGEVFRAARELRRAA